jgi:phage major head subunit gpT-like protein
MALTPSFVFDFESNMQAITEQEYARMSQNLWWQRFTKIRPSSSKKEIIAWLLSTAMIKPAGKGGSISFDDLVATYTTFENLRASTGLKLLKDQMLDLDGGGLELASKWSADIGAYMAYWPQKQVVGILKNGATASLVSSYDGVAFFANNHPLNPFDSSVGTFANIFTGAAASTPSTDPNDAGYPGACPIDTSVAVDVALDNLGKIYGYIKGIRMPNGEDPRFLRPRMLIVPPRLFPRAVQLTSAKFIAQAATGGAGSADVEALITALGYTMPVEADELAGFESDTTYYVVCEEITTSQLGAVVYVEREPFSITYYTGAGGGTGVDAILDRSLELEWHCQGRNVTGPGHPYLIFKVKAT